VVENDVSARPPNLTSASCDLDFSPPDTTVDRCMALPNGEDLRVRFLDCIAFMCSCDGERVMSAITKFLVHLLGEEEWRGETGGGGEEIKWKGRCGGAGNGNARKNNPKTQHSCIMGTPRLKHFRKFFMFITFGTECENTFLYFYPTIHKSQALRCLLKVCSVQLYNISIADSMPLH